MGMRTFQTQSQPVHRGAASSSLHKLNMSPLSTASITMAALLILTVPVCKSAPTELQQATTDQRQLLSQPLQIDALCSFYLSADLKLWKLDVLGELCVLMLVQKLKELKVQENSKRTPLLHPLLHLLSQLHTRGEKGLFSMHEDIHGPGGIQSRGHFLYRPRNGRRSLEYE